MQQETSIVLLILALRNGQMHLHLLPEYALPRGSMKREEDAHAAAVRLSGELFPGQQPYVEQLYTFTDPPKGESREIAIAYLCILPQGIPRQAGDCVVALEGKRLLLCSENGSEISETALPDGEARMIRIALTRLQGKIDYTDIGFYFLRDREAFSLGELMEVYETVLCREMDASNFRRDMLRRYRDSGKLQQTDRAVRQRLGRPAAVFRFDENGGKS